jgi:DNA-binding XRE family transcriptional regulator
MTSTEYKATRQRLGMTQAALAEALNVSRKAINQREQGGTITRESAMALELLAVMPLLVRVSCNTATPVEVWSWLKTLQSKIDPSLSP